MARPLRLGLDFLNSMGGRIFVVLLLGMALASSVAATLSERDRRGDIDRLYAERAADHVQETMAWLNDRAAGGSTVPRPRRMSVKVVPAPQAGGRPDPSFVNMLKARLGAAAQPTARRVDGEICRRARTPTPRPSAYAGVLEPSKCWSLTARMKNGKTVALLVDTPPRLDPKGGVLNPWLTTGLFLCAALLAFYASHTAAAPLRRLARASDAFGADLDQPPLAENGPGEVASAARAFNAMQRRIRRHLGERTQMLAAISHDLQTPATRLRLRLEKVEDPILREKLIADLGAMQALIREGLSLARSAEQTEPLIWTDLDSLVGSLVEDEADAGRKVTIAGECGCDAQIRPDAVRRALGNLIDNAIAYGGGAELSVGLEGKRAIIRINDRGPGIEAAKLNAVFDPFMRIERSRSRETGGAGLGLTIARTLVEQCGGTVELENRAGGGLTATVSLPARRARGPA